jgi:hypothetical protein
MECSRCVPAVMFQPANIPADHIPLSGQCRKIKQDSEQVPWEGSFTI